MEMVKNFKRRSASAGIHNKMKQSLPYPTYGTKFAGFIGAPVVHEAVNANFSLPHPT